MPGRRLAPTGDGARSPVTRSRCLASLRFSPARRASPWCASHRPERAPGFGFSAFPAPPAASLHAPCRNDSPRCRSANAPAARAESRSGPGDPRGALRPHGLSSPAGADTCTARRAPRPIRRRKGPRPNTGDLSCRSRRPAAGAPPSSLVLPARCSPDRR